MDVAIPRWLRSPHLQTLGAAVPLFAPPRSHARRAEEYLRIPIDDRHRVHGRAWWADGPSDRPVVVIVHGIGGQSTSRYVVRAAVALHRAGYHVVRLDLRGTGDSMVDAPSMYHAGLTSDLADVVTYLAGRPRVSGVSILGFSGGGSIALKLAGEWGKATPAVLRAIVSVSAPLDYTVVAPWMEGLGRLPYRFHVLRGLIRNARAFAKYHPDKALFDPEALRRLGTIRAFDAQVIVPMHGFRDVDDYYTSSCSGPWLDKINVPSLLIHADDDPMVPGFSVKPWLARRSASVDVAITPHGGHIGWVSGLDEASWVTGYATRRALRFFAEKIPAQARA